MDGNVSPGATRTLPPLAAVADTKAADHANVPSAHTVAQAGRRLEKGQGRIEVEVADRRQGIDTDPGHTAPIGTDQGRGHLIIPVDALGHHVPADIKQRQLLTNAKQYILCARKRPIPYLRSSRDSDDHSGLSSGDEIPMDSDWSSPGGGRGYYSPNHDPNTLGRHPAPVQEHVSTPNNTKRSKKRSRRRKRNARNRTGNGHRH